MSYMNEATVLRTLANRVTIIAKSKVLIIQFVTTHDHIPVDIGTNQINGVGGVRRALRMLFQLPRSWNIDTDGGSYFSKARGGWQDPNKPHLLCIEDPNDMCA
jgi:DNA polymerase sigma